MLLLLRLNMTAMLRGRWARGHGGMGSIRWTCFLLFHMTATAGTAAVASFTKTMTNTSFTLSLRWMMMEGNFDIPIVPCRRGGGRRTGR